MEEIMKAEKSTKSERKLTGAGKVILGICGATFVAITAVTTPFLIPAMRRYCLPYVPATIEQVTNVTTLLQNGGAKSKLGRLVDLGSGDGRIVIACSKVGYTKCEGVELNPWLTAYSKYNAWKAKQPVQFHTKDIWKVDFSKYENIVIFGVPSMMPQLEKKLKDEMLTTGQVIACRFSMPNARPANTIDAGIDTVWRYDRESFNSVK